MLVLRIEDVDKRLTGSNDQLAELNEHIVVKYLAHSARHDIVNRAKAAIIDGLAEGDERRRDLPKKSDARTISRADGRRTTGMAARAP